MAGAIAAGNINKKISTERDSTILSQDVYSSSREGLALDCMSPFTSPHTMIPTVITVTAITR